MGLQLQPTMSAWEGDRRSGTWRSAAPGAPSHRQPGAGTGRGHPAAPSAGRAPGNEKTNSAEAKRPERITGFSESPPAPSSFNTSTMPPSWEDICFKNTCVGIIKSARAKFNFDLLLHPK